MRILLDENLPEVLVVVLRQLGHQVDSVNSLGMKGADDSMLYLVAQRYDLCLTETPVLLIAFVIWQEHPLPS